MTSPSRALSLSAIIAVSVLSIASPSPLQNSNNPILSTSSTLSIQQHVASSSSSSTPASLSASSSTIENINNPLQLQYHRRPSSSNLNQQQQQPPAPAAAVVVRYYATWNPTSPCSPKSASTFDAWEESYTSLIDCCEEKFGWDLETCLSPSPSSSL